MAVVQQVRRVPRGCFIFSVAAEFDAKPGRVRDEIARTRQRWLGAYAALISAAQQRGELDGAADPAALAAAAAGDDVDWSRRDDDAWATIPTAPTTGRSPS